MLRWRFLASGYRTLSEFDDVLGCDSWRTTLKLTFRRHGKGSKWYPAKSQFLALLWLLTFLAFNVLAALVGLTYSIDVSDTMVDLARGNISVAELRYISQIYREDFTNYSFIDQASAASIWEKLPFGDGMLSGRTNPTIIMFDPCDTWWHIFTDYNPDQDTNKHALSTRTLNVTARCTELEIVQSGYAGFGNPELLRMLDEPAGILPCAIGWSVIIIAVSGEEIDELHYSMVQGDNPVYNPQRNATADDIAGVLMKFTVGSIAAMDQPTGHRQLVTATERPNLAQNQH